MWNDNYHLGEALKQKCILDEIFAERGRMWINVLMVCLIFLNYFIQKQPSRGVLRKRCSENTQQIYRRTPMPKCDFMGGLLQICCIFSEHLFLRTRLDGCFCSYKNTWIVFQNNENYTVSSSEKRYCNATVLLQFRPWIGISLFTLNLLFMSQNSC